MPTFKTGKKLVYYAHVPKCGGSAVEYYLQDRFGLLGFYDHEFHKKRYNGTSWTRTSPQHVDVATLERVLPISFFDEMFAVVRHPVPRTVSTYHFQREVEKQIDEGTSFSTWLERLEAEGFTPYEYDNHVLPMNRLVPEGAQVFHLEHGLDGIVVWLDLLTGTEAPPRAIGHANARGAVVAVKSEKVVPTPQDIERIARIYAEDFARFGYKPSERAPKVASPTLTAAFMAERDRTLKAMRHPVRRLLRRARRRLFLG